jgi:cell division inhibitor SepF
MEIHFIDRQGICRSTGISDRDILYFQYSIRKWRFAAMGLIDRFLNAIKLNDDFDDDEDFLDDDDDVDDLDNEEESRSKKKRFFSRFSADDDDDDFDDEQPVTSRTSERRSTERKISERKKPSSSYRSSSSSSTSASSSRSKSSQSSVSSARTVSYASRPSSRDEKERAVSSDPRKKQPKVTPIRKKNSLSSMEVNVIRPSSMEDTRDIADTLLQNCTVVLNLEGLDVDIAQRVIDFTCGVCYSLNGNLQKVSSYIFILTPENVELSGDFQSILSGAFDLAPMRSGF